MSNRKILARVLGQKQQRVLLNALRATFGRGNFDATEVAVRATNNPDLKAAIDAAVPGCRLKPRQSRRRSINGLAVDVLRDALSELVEQHFDTDQYGWWRLKSSDYLQSEAPPVLRKSTLHGARMRG
jgi:hypothetical protein